MADRYVPQDFESKWRARWREANLFATREDAGRPKFFGLDFFPYPSGAGLSVGHCRNYVPTDVLCRVKFMQGYNVLHPMGFDAFGLPAENEAIAKQTHPAPMIRQYGENYRRQMDLVGIGYDWSRSFYSSDPSYYRWTQWIFELLYKRGLAYRKNASVNWCPKDQTVLANEEVEGGKCWRCGTLVEQKQIPQWFFKITDFADRLLNDLEKVDWPEGIKALQRNWIGRSEGVEFSMKIVFSNSNEVKTDDDDGFLIPPKDKQPMLRVFTTRIDTLFGVTFCVIAPEHPLMETILSHASDSVKTEVGAYIQSAKELSDIDRQATNRAKTGVFTGAYAINPGSGEKIPIYVADYVLIGYGTGAIMAVPGHDQRDFEFAKAFGLPILQVIAPTADSEAMELTEAFESKDGVLVNSGGYSGLTVAAAQDSMGEWMEGLGIGERVVNYRFRDWLISRQRYWGCPIPVIHSKEGEVQLVPENLLPVELPDIPNYQPAADGASPLRIVPEFLNVTDLDGTLGERETDTMGGFACSSWYFLRFCDPHNPEKAWDLNKVNYWMPVDCYVGGAEHAVMHLLYARFWMKALYDEGLVPVEEPFQRLMNQGQVLALTPYRKPFEDEKLQVGEDGILCSFAEAKVFEEEIKAGKRDEDFLFYRWARMSKSKGNVVTPDEMVDQYGADALRVYELFVAPFEADVQWSNDGVAGAARFLNRVFKFIDEQKALYDPNWKDQIDSVPDSASSIRRPVHQAIHRVTENIERFAFNTTVSELMKCLNALQDAAKNAEFAKPEFVPAWSEALESFILLLSPIAPFSADELWESIGRSGFTYHANWPKSDPAIAAEDTVTIAVQVNGKLRDTIQMPAGASNAGLESAAVALPKVQAHTDGKTLRKVIVVPGKLVNIVVS